MKRVLSAVAVCLCAASSQAANISLDSISGYWSTATPSASVSGVGTSAISWGKPATSAGQSGYTFEAGTLGAVSGSPFKIGDFIHSNNPIYATKGKPHLDMATLSVSLKGNVDGVSFSLDGDFVFRHNETPNIPGQCQAGSHSVCDDIVTLESYTLGAETINVNGVSFAFSLDGFGDNPGNFFETMENAENVAGLYGSFIEIPPPAAPELPPIPAVPAPPAGLLLASGVAVLIRRKRRA